jgi:hypothetical protein
MRIFRLGTLFAVLAALVLASCQLGLEVPSAPDQGIARSVVLPSGATLQAAKVSVFANLTTASPSFPIPIDVHKVNVAWDENTVTWDSFYASPDNYLTAPFASFGVTNAWGWHTVDITALVGSWIAGTSANHGILLSQTVQPNTIVSFLSSDNVTNETVEWAIAHRPKLDVVYLSPDSATPITLTIQDTGMENNISDAAILSNSEWRSLPFGQGEWLYVGQFEGAIKQSLVGFDIIVTPGGGYTLTQGYWKTHAGFGPQADAVTPLLPVWLGTVGGTKSIQIVDAALGVAVFNKKAYGGASNGIAKLYAQLLAAKLNIANGASGAAVAGVIVESDQFLADNSWNGWSSLSSGDKTKVLWWANMLDAFNNGIIGPGHAAD